MLAALRGPRSFLCGKGRWLFLKSSCTACVVVSVSRRRLFGSTLNSFSLTVAKLDALKRVESEKGAQYRDLSATKFTPSSSPARSPLASAPRSPAVSVGEDGDLRCSGDNGGYESGTASEAVHPATFRNCSPVTASASSSSGGGFSIAQH